jgi:hypothetical protein
MFLTNIDKILQAMPDVENGYYLPFHEGHLDNFKGIIEYESQSITIEDRKRFLIFQSHCGPCVTAFVNRRPVAMFGLMFHWQGVGEAWSLFAEESRRYPIAMTKGAFSFFDICKILFNEEIVMGGLVGGGKPDTSAAEESLRMQREETARARQAAEEEKRTLAEQMSASKRARRVGGKRMLLAQRVTPETGMDEDENLLGTKG